MRYLSSVFAVIIFVLVATSTHAGSITSIDFVGDPSNPESNGLGDFEGKITYDSTQTIPLLTVSLKNTTPAGGGLITGFLFNVVGDVTLSINDFSPYTGFSLMSPTTSASPFGDFEWGGAVGGSFTGGGTPSDGVPVGITGTFKFDVADGTTTAAANLMALDFFTELSTGNGAGDHKKVPFIVRFQSIGVGEDSDKVPGVTAPLPPQSIVPLPSAVWAGLAMLGILAAARSRRRR